MTTEPSLANVSAADAVRAARLVESVVGNAWATDAAGQFTYVTPAMLEGLGLTREDLNSSPDKDSFGWKRMLHPSDCAAAAERWRHCLRTGEHYNIEHRMLRAAGVYGWSRCSGQPLRDAGGRIAGWYGTVMGGGTSSYEPPSVSLIHPDDMPAAAQAASRAFASGVPQIMSCRQRQPDGSYRWTELRADPDYRVSVDVEPMVQLAGERWTVAEALGKTAAAVRAAQVLENLYGAAFAFDASGTFTYATPVAQTSIAMTLDDLNRQLDGKTFIDGGDLGWKLGVHPDDYEGVAATLRHCLRTGEHFHYEYRVLRATGHYVWHRFAIRPTHDDRGRITGWYGTGTDIDVYKKTEAALRERERQLQRLIDAVPALIWCATPGGVPSYVNKRLTETVGLTVQDLVAVDAPRSLADVHPADCMEVEEALAHSFATGTAFARQYRQRRAGGGYRWTQGRAEPLRDESGRIVQWYGVCIDIEELMTTQKALYKRESELSHLVDMIPSHIWRLTSCGVPTFFNKRMVDFLGMDVSDTRRPDMTPLDALLALSVHPEDAGEMGRALKECLATGKSFAMRYRLRRNDGVYCWMSSRAEPMRDESGSIVQWYGLCHDISEQVNTQEALRHASEQLARATHAASLAELSASIAHEVNQPLAAIVANSHACHRWLSGEPPNVKRAKVTAERIIRDANSAADVVGRIRALFQRVSGPKTDSALRGLIDEVRDLLAEEAARCQVRVVLDIEPGLPAIPLDRIQIQQVLVNISRNGMEAMENQTEERVLHISACRAESELRVKISDRGDGIASPEKIFEPFFTTKERGMGMGLAICRSIIEAHGGRLWAEGDKARGATFVIALPIKTSEAS